MALGLETMGGLLGGLIEGGAGGFVGADLGAAAGGAVGGGGGMMVAGPPGAVVGGGGGAITGAVLGGGAGAALGALDGWQRGGRFGKELGDWIWRSDEAAEEHPAEPTDGCTGNCGPTSSPATSDPVAGEVAPPPLDVYIPQPAAGKHIEDAQAAGHPAEITIDRGPQVDNRRRASTSGTPTSPGMDRDEYPPAISSEGGAGASVRSIPSGDNRSAGGTLGSQIRDFPNGTRVRIIPRSKPP